MNEHSTIISADNQPLDPAPLNPAAHVRGKDLDVAAHGLRGYAALMVLGAHILGGTARHVYADAPHYVAGVQAPWFLGTFGVQLFFVISGFVILPSVLRYSPKEFFLRRGLRLYPLFGALSILFIALNWATNLYPEINNWKSIVSGLLFINLFTGTDQLTPNAWSLSYEVIFYLLTCAVVTFTVKRPGGALAVLSVAAATAFLIWQPMSAYFLCGALIWLSPKPARSTDNWKALELGLFTALVYLASRGHYEYTSADLGNPVVIALMLVTPAYFYCAVVPGSLTAQAMDNRAMRWFGTISYSLYLVHPYIYFLVRTAFVKLGLFTPSIGVSVLLFAIPTILLSLLAAHLANLTLERKPYELFFRQRIYGKS